MGTVEFKRSNCLDEAIEAMFVQSGRNVRAVGKDVTDLPKLTNIDECVTRNRTEMASEIQPLGAAHCRSTEHRHSGEAERFRRDFARPLGLVGRRGEDTVIACDTGRELNVANCPTVTDLHTASSHPVPVTLFGTAKGPALIA